MEKVKLSICGRDFALKTENPEKLEKVAADLSHRIKTVKEMGVTMSFTDIVMLVALDIAETNYDNSQIIAEAEASEEKIRETEEKAAKEINIGKEKISSLEAELAELKVSLSQSQDELKALKTQYAGVDPEAEVKLIEENRTLSNQIKALQDKNDSLEEAIATLEAECTNAEEKSSQAAAAEAEILQLKTALSDARDEITTLKEQQISIDTEAEARLIEKNKSLEDQLKSLQAINDRLEETIKALESKNETTEMENTESASEEIEQLRTTVATYEKTFDEYATQKNAEVKALNDELNALRKKYSDLSAQMNEIVNDGQLTL
ncbi:MAG: cell division protein ZapA [Ruminiclostridium sp.]|nr:cell division protein ZapA [Ruminiclostridium sp.]